MLMIPDCLGQVEGLNKQLDAWCLGSELLSSQVKRESEETLPMSLLGVEAVVEAFEF